MTAGVAYSIERIAYRKNLIIGFVALFSILYSLFSPDLAFAQTYPITSTEQPINTQYLPPQSPHTASLAIYNFSHAISCILIGQSPISPCLEYKVFTDAQGVVKSIPVLNTVNTSHGLLGATVSILQAIYQTPPVGSSEFIANLGQEIGLVKEANAQVGGSGSGVLSPIFTLWKLSRDIAYVFMIVVFLIVGLMVMFRQKLNPQTVVTIQLALPGLILGLIMITFSYFLASLITDLGFLSINLVGYYFAAAQGNGAQDLLAAMDNQNLITMMSRFTGAINSGDIASILDTIYQHSSTDVRRFMIFIGFLATYQVGASVGHAVPVIGDIVAPLLGTLTGLVTSALALPGTFGAQGHILGIAISWVAMAVVIYSMVMLLINLITNYLSIIFLTITGPFQFMAASLPGRQEIATDWMRNMLCNVLAFPAVVAVLYFVAFIQNETRIPYSITQPLQLYGNQTMPLLGGLNEQLIRNLIAFGALIALPSIPAVVCRVIGKLGPAGQMLGSEASGNIRSAQPYSNQWSQAGGNIRSGAAGYQNFRGRPPGWSPAYGLESGSGIWGGLGQRFIQNPRINRILGGRANPSP